MSKLGQITFILNLVSLRKIKRLTQEDVANQTKISVRKYQRLESGEASPSLDDIYSLANVLGVEPGTLVNHSKECLITKEVNKEMILKEKDEHALEFLIFLENYFLPTYASVNSKGMGLDLLFKDPIFLNHKLALACTNFKANVYNKNHGHEKFGEAEQYTGFIGEDFQFPLSLVAHFNHILHMGESFYYFDSEKVLIKNDKPGWHTLGYVHRYEQNYFALVVKLKNKWLNLNV